MNGERLLNAHICSAVSICYRIYIFSFFMKSVVVFVSDYAVLNHICRYEALTLAPISPAPEFGITLNGS